MTERRREQLRKKAVEIVAQEARHLADCADYDEICKTDEEDEFLRDELRAIAQAIDLRMFTELRGD